MRILKKPCLTLSALIFGSSAVGVAGWTLAADTAGGHAAAAAPSVGAIHTAPPAASVQVHSSGSTISPSAATAARTSQSTPSQITSGNRSPANASGEHTGRGDHRHTRQSIYGLYYGDPWWGNTYYGNGYNPGYYNDVTYTPDGAITNTGTNSDVAPAPVQSVPSAASASDSGAAESAQLTNAIDKSPAMVSANGEIQMAQVAYDKERERVLAELSAKPEYQQALDRQHNAMGDLHQAKAAATTSPAVMDAATAKLDASDEVTKMQEQAVATDPAAAAAKTHLAEAVANRDELRAKMMAQH